MVMVGRFRRVHGFIESYSASSLIRLWILRLLVPLGGRKEFTCCGNFSNDALARAIGLEKWLEPEKKFVEKEIHAELHRMYRESERLARNSSVSACLVKNVARLAALVGLSTIDCRILEFVVTLRNENLLREAAERLGMELSTSKMFYILAVVLDISEHEIPDRLS